MNVVKEKQMKKLSVPHNTLNLAIGRGGGQETEIRDQLYPDYQNVSKEAGEGRLFDLKNTAGHRIDLKKTSNTRPQLDGTKFADLSQSDRSIEIHFLIYKSKGRGKGQLQTIIVATYGEIQDNLDPKWLAHFRETKRLMNETGLYIMERFYLDLSTCKQTLWAGATEL
jgi:hypothetical protein